MSRSVPLVTVLAVTLSASPFQVALAAVDCSVADRRFGVSLGNTFNLTLVGLSSADLQTAVDYWSGCAGYGTEIPTFQTGGSGGIPVTIVKIAGNSTSPTGTCGRIVYDEANGRIEGASITVWTRNRDGVSCDPITDSLAHEFGHLLGLDHIEDLSCAGHIMGRAFGDGSRRSVGVDDCAVADDQWDTAAEIQPSPEPFCDTQCWTSCVNNTCPQRPPDMEGCPILIDLEGDGIRLTGLGDPVWFDIDADGSRDLMTWTNRGDGLLALDRNGDGVINHGGELFGDATRFQDGRRASNGYTALAELDTWIFGGNGDGFLDASDAAFSALQLWKDQNHDGISQASELRSCLDAGLRRLGLDYRRSHRTDRYGNRFRFFAKAWRLDRFGELRVVPTWDVFFVVVP